MKIERAQRIQQLAYDYADQPKEWVACCNLCGGDYFVQLCDHDRYGYEVGAFACGRCGLVFLNPRLTSSAYSDFYAQAYRPLVSAYHGRLIDAKTVQAEQASYAIERGTFAAPYLADHAGGRFLDIGGSTGVVAQYFAERFGYTGVVLDPSAAELREAEKRGLTTVQGLFEEADFGKDKFDLVLLCQTIDHLLDISLTLKKVSDCLLPNGIFFVDIVDFRAGYLRHWNVNQAVKIDHPYYLTQETVETYLSRNGFKLLRKGYAADHLHISYVCTRGEPNTDALTGEQYVQQFLREVRTVQNAPRGAA